MSGIVVDLGAVDRGRLREHLAESRRLMTAPLERMDESFYRRAFPLEDLTIKNTLTVLADALVEAVGRKGLLELDVPAPSRQDCYCFSGWLEASAARAAGGGWRDTAGDLGGAVDRIRQAWDARYGVEGTPAERSWFRTAAAWKPAKVRRVLWGPRTAGDAA